MNHLGADSKAVITRFVYNMCNGLLAYPLLENYDYRSVLMEQPSAAEQAIAVLLNVIEVDDAGLVGNAEYAEFRAGQCIRSYCDIDFEAAPPFEYWETERASYRWRSSGPMP